MLVQVSNLKLEMHRATLQIQQLETVKEDRRAEMERVQLNVAAQQVNHTASAAATRLSSCLTQRI